MHILNVERITNEKWLNLFAATFEHKGHTGRWVFASRKTDPHGQRGGDAVVIVPILRMPDEPPRLVLAKEFRVPIGDYVFNFPAGLMEPGESIENAVRRELREETGMEVVAFKRVSPPLYSSSGMTDESAVMAFVDVRITPESELKLEASEDIEVVLLDFAGVCRLCDNATARVDVRTWTMMALYQQMGQLV